jgi:hypothetical protein
MMRSNRVPTLVVPFLVLLLAIGQTLRAASPGPDETAESKSYDVTATSRSQSELTGSFEFVGDPDRPQRSESGDFSATLATADDATSASGAGTWWSRSFWFFSFWLAQADSAETDFRMFAIGVVWNEELHGTLYVYGGDDVAQGRYRLSATAVAEPAPTEPTEPEPTTEPAATTE